jgi:diaminohydroxyphosphoribosylaminopyrimidine deaminase / 5-amino-6-(5-phosphoribosylamino)uracil reductase
MHNSQLISKALPAHNSPLYMKRALQLARLGAGAVSPNPMVGCVIVHHGKIIGEGWHQKYGEAHAEVNAVNSVLDKSILSESEVYVTLEPCSHFGKTPPCADLLIKHQVKKVYVCNLDPNPLVAGKGIEKLRQAGIEVEMGLLETEGRELNKRFFTFIEKKRPYIILKWAESADGFIAKKNYEAIQISNLLSRRFVHKMRSQEDAILVGTNTAKYDNPKLDTRFWTGKNAIRLVIDKQLSLPETHHLFDKSQTTICFNNSLDKQKDNISFVKIPENTSLEKFILEELYQRKIQSVIIEGGTKLLQSFIDLELYDEAVILKSQKLLGDGITAPKIDKKKVYKENLGDNEILHSTKRA